ncbi:hypothetical protein T07_14651 [Trichinella nelsoni]|uniref:Uncharacterized protein n=1 Tax=Trichinella nelsoni TaxID=6336 RepID=A0A0V0RDZ8_9BILA|nr:hypothetical protein T07_14651 [Trichinella nelsoni]
MLNLEMRCNLRLDDCPLFVVSYRNADSAFLYITVIVSAKAECIKINADNKSNPDQQPKHFTAVALKLKI